ncbi:hypothetical protein [Sulfurovum sp.]|uniref:hypothetical protein n=1 Tax=Sulfurovum sp. TaxID=1969726 RepID=UPI003567866A
MNIATKTFKDFVIALKQASTKGFNKPVQINYQYGYFLAELQEGEAVDYKEKLNKLSGDETDHLFDVMNGLLEWNGDNTTTKVIVDKPVEKEDIVIEREKPAVSAPTKPKRNSRKKV